MPRLIAFLLLFGAPALWVPYMTYQQTTTASEQPVIMMTTACAGWYVDTTISAATTARMPMRTNRDTSVRFILDSPYCNTHEYRPRPSITAALAEIMRRARGRSDLPSAQDSVGLGRIQC